MAPIVFELMPGKGLIGRVLDTATGLAVRGIEVELVSAESQPTGDRTHPASRRLDTTNAEGRFTFEDLPSAQYRIGLRRENKVVQVSAPVSPRTPAEDRTIWLRATNIVTGTLLSPNGTRLPGVKLYVTRDMIAGIDNTYPGYNTTTDGSGRFEFTDLLPGSYKLSGTAVPEPGVSLVYHQTLVVTGEPDQVVEIRPGGPCEISVSVSLPLNASGAGVFATAAGPPRRAYQGFLHEGRIRLVGLPEGDYRITAFFLVGEQHRIQVEKKVTLTSSNPAVIHIDAQR